MNTEKVLEILRAIGNFTEDEVKKYSSLVEINMHPFAENEYDESDEALLEYFVATKTNYQIALASGDSEISSFKAGDVSITSSTNGIAVKNAKALLDDACASISHLVADKSFYFREV
ncbi:MAG: hypothetical protein MR480_06195 [Eubacterium coprostanoligenes]|uniref:hypothetical protein n=1 Tax=Eubacterium coprostanoligenes TaxID=290054 RepID=UPI002357CCE6|nr:hypothetical protein [Eubacterium coprostanoligenes]MCI7265232.1 hypothetical protein [Eubacterium coprostanoligenes]